MNRPLGTYVLLIAAAVLVAVVPVPGYGDIDGFRATVRELAALEDRSSGTPGNEAAVELIRGRFRVLGPETTGTQIFSVTTRQHGPARLSLPDQQESLPLYPLKGNMISPNSISPRGIEGPLIYAGTGAMKAFNGKPVAGAVVLMEMNSGRNWLNAASLGAKALIYIDRGEASKAYFEDKVELSPISFPRFWMPLAAARKHLGAFETAASGVAGSRVRLSAATRWSEVPAHNPYVLIPGSDPHMAGELIIVEAYYDPSPAVPGLAPGADESCGIATLLELARRFSQAPPKRSVLLVATGGHGQTLAGMRELVWSLVEKSKQVKRLEKQLKTEIKMRGKVIEDLDNALTAADRQTDGLGLAAGGPAMAALHDRIKTEVDTMSRQLMRLRLEQKGAERTPKVQPLAERRQALRRLGWQRTYDDPDPGERAILRRLLPLARDDQHAVLETARQQLAYIKSARKIRALVKSYELQAMISLHLSSHGDGVGAFNQGWLYPLKPTVNRVGPYVQLNDVLQAAGERLRGSPLDGLFKDTLRPSRKRPWQSYLPDRPALGGEISALGGILGITLATTNDIRARWGTPHDTENAVDFDYAYRQAQLVHALVLEMAGAPRLLTGSRLRKGFATVTGRANFLRHGELFADQPAPGSVIMAFQGDAIFHSRVDPMGLFRFKGVADKKHVLQKVIMEGYRFDGPTGDVQWAIDKEQTGKAAYRLKVNRRQMEVDLVMFACRQTTLFDMLEPRTFRYMTKLKLIDGRREAPPLRYWYSRIDTRASTIVSTYLEPDTRLKMTLSDTVLRKKLILLNADETTPLGTGYHVQHFQALHQTGYQVARDMWTLLKPRIENLERHGIHNQRIRGLQQQGEAALAQAAAFLGQQQYDRFSDAAARAWALASRVYDDVEQTQKDVLFGVLFYIALFVPFSFCMERLLFSYRSIYKRIIAFCAILLLLIGVIYNVHPAFQLAYSPTVVILAFFIMGLSLLVTLIIFFRFEDEMTSLQRSARRLRAGELSHWKAFLAAFMLGISNLRRRRLRTTLTCLTLIILTFTIMSFTAVKSSRQHSRLKVQDRAPYQGLLMKHVNWQSLPPEALGHLENVFGTTSWVAPRVWLEGEDRTRPTPVAVAYQGRRFEAHGLVGLGAEEVRVTGLDVILTQGRWLAPGAANELLMPRRMAQALGIDLRQPSSATVRLWGQPFEVVGIFSGDLLQQRVDLDGEPLTPVTFPRELSTALTEVEMDALESGEDVRAFQSRYEHTAGDRTLIIPYRTLMAGGGQLKGVAVRSKQKIDQAAQAEDLIDRFGLALFSGESAGTFLYHAGDTMSYSGAPNIVIPLVISVFIVLNTMIGSVYERKREIGIYTSVGLAPSHVAFLFIAEAMAFAVISVVLGYLVAQVSAGLLADTSLWSGITVNYSSLSGVAAMALVILVVLVSVIYPAKVAAQIAIPDINRSWKLPPAQGNRLELKLPFLMKHHEHLSVAGYLHDFFQGHLDVSHGVFSTGDILLDVDDHGDPDTHGNDARGGSSCVRLSSRVWLAPFDLGIMQSVDFAFAPVAGESGFLEISIVLRRQSGEANAWHRINKVFLDHVRRQLLMWRSLDTDEKQHFQAMLDEPSADRHGAKGEG